MQIQMQEQEATIKKEAKTTVAEAVKPAEVTPKAIFNKALEAFKQKHNNLNIKSAHELEALFKKDKKLKQDFENELAEKIKEAGLNMSSKAVFKTAMREMKAEEYRRDIATKLMGIQEDQEKTIKKLSALFDSVARQSGEEDVFKFYHKYNTDPKFRMRANAILMREIQSDPELSQRLGNERPENIMHELAGLKASFMSKTDAIKFAVKETFKHMPVEMAKSGAIVVGGLAHSLMLAPVNAVLNSMPGMAGASYMAMHSLQHVTDAFNKISQAVGNIKTSTSQNMMEHYTVETLKKVGEEVSKNLPASS